MRILFTLSVILAITIVNCHDFKGPLNLKKFGVTIFNVEDETQLVVGNEQGQLMISKFSKTSQIVNYKSQRVHYATIVGIKRLPSKQYITIGSKGIIAKWSSDLKKKINVKIYNPHQTNIIDTSFITNQENVKGNARFALNFGDEIIILSTVDLSQIAVFNCQSLYKTSQCTILRITYINNILLVYGYENDIISIDINGNVRTLTTPQNEEFYYVSQFNSANDHRSNDGFAITNIYDLVHFNITITPNSTSLTISNRSQIQFDPNENGQINGINYCKRKNYNPANMKTQKLETVILVSFTNEVWFYLYNNETKKYEHGETYFIDDISQVQCYEDEAFILARNGNNDIIQIINLEYLYISPKDSGFATFFIVALILIVVFYQIKKYRLKKQVAKQVNNDSKYIQLQQRITISNVYNN